MGALDTTIAGSAGRFIAAGVSDVVAVVVVLTLLTLLVAKEVLEVSPHRRWLFLSHGLSIAIVPLGLAFLAIAAAQVLRVLR